MVISLPVNLGLVRELRHVHPFRHVNVQEEYNGAQSAKRAAHEHIWGAQRLFIIVRYRIKCTSFSARATAVVFNRVTRQAFSVPAVHLQFGNCPASGHAAGDTREGTSLFPAEMFC